MELLEHLDLKELELLINEDSKFKSKLVRRNILSKLYNPSQKNALDAVEILEHLNKKRSTLGLSVYKGTPRQYKAILKGLGTRTKKEALQVIDHLYKKWKDDYDMRLFIRIETMFDTRGKFLKYLGEISVRDPIKQKNFWEEL